MFYVLYFYYFMFYVFLMFFFSLKPFVTVLVLHTVMCNKRIKYYKAWNAQIDFALIYIFVYKEYIIFKSSMSLKTDISFGDLTIWVQNRYKIYF